MTFKRIIPGMLLTLTGFSLGLMLERHLRSTTGAQVKPPETTLVLRATEPPAASDAELPDNAVLKTHKTASVAEIERALQEAAQLSPSQRYKALNKIVESVESSQIPQVLAIVEKLWPKLRAQLRPMLL